MAWRPKVGRAGGQPVLHHHQASAGRPPFGGGQRLQRQRQAEVDSARAKVGCHTSATTWQPSAFDTSFTARTCCARSCGPATSDDSVFRWRRDQNRRASPAWKWPSGRLRPQFRGHRNKLLLPGTPLGALHRHVGGPRWPGRHARPFAQRLSRLTPSMKRAHPQRGNRWPTTKNLGAGAGLWWAVQRASVSQPTTWRPTAPRHPMRVGNRHQRLRRHRHRSDRLRRRAVGASAAIYSYLQAGVGCACATPFTAAALVEEPRQSHQCRWPSVGYWHRQLRLGFPRISAGWGINTTSYDKRSGVMCV